MRESKQGEQPPRGETAPLKRDRARAVKGAEIERTRIKQLPSLPLFVADALVCSVNAV